ncbi:uncharacterized protein LOC130796614 [Actinidia eriantha]|uniref:uncharacterized protein LOC130796614 n=1 Tax=Actinidia eriantha TaxID=165200 RepID=UPI0025911098|nr:uncharacterized protein LOC130796614 [Actinidia eriantha]
MDSKDSSLSSSSSMAGSRDAEEDGVLPAAAVLAKDASVAFHSGKFAECVDLLNQLLQKKETDPKVLQNIAVGRYFQDGCSDPRKLLEVLNNVKEQSDELARASGEHSEAVSNLGSKAVIGPKGTNNAAHQFSSADNLHIVYGDEFDTSVTMLNIAVIWFHLREYAKAYSILDSLYQKIEPIDEATALHICLLFLDVALALHDPSKFIDVINYVEKAYCASNLISQSDNGSSAQQQSPNLVTKSSSFPSNSTATDASNTDSIGSVNASESPLSRTLSEENLETLISTIDMSGQNLARSSGLQSANDLSRTPADHSISTSDLKLKLQLYKVRFLLLARNLKATKREVKTALSMNVACGKDSSMALLLKSELEYARGNYRKAIKLLVASTNRSEIGMASIYYNNLGCIYHQLGKYHTSTVFFSKALSNSSSFRKEKPLKLATFSQDQSLQIVYNCGVLYLACGKPILAARCFHKASLIFYNRPLLWLRITECCLMALEKGLLKTSRAHSDRSEVKVHVIGEGKWRQLAVEDRISGNGQVNFVEKDDWFLGDDKQPNLSVTLARQSLFNALYLLNCSETTYLKSGLPRSSTLEDSESREVGSFKNANSKSVSCGDSKASSVMVGSDQIIANGDFKEQKWGNIPNPTLQSSILDYEDIRRRENQMIKQALLADLAYVELELGNPLKALSTAKSLLELPECSRIYIFLGIVYSAESLCLLNRPKEAANHLLTYLSGGSNVELPFSEEDHEQLQFPKILDFEELNGGLLNSKNSSPGESHEVVFLKPEEARGTLYANLATFFAVQGDLEQAHRFVVQALSTIPNSPEATLTAIYLDLVAGKTQEALSKLKHCSRIRFLPGSLTLKGSS